MYVVVVVGTDVPVSVDAMEVSSGGSPGVGATGNCQLPNMSVGDQTRALSKSSKSSDHWAISSAHFPIFP